MKKRLLSVLLILCLAAPVLPASAFSVPSDTNYWVGQTQAQVADMVRRITSKTETRDLVLVCFPNDGAANISTAVTMFSNYANQNSIKLYYCAFPGEDSGKMGDTLSPLFDSKSEEWPNWPIAVTYNTSTQNDLSREYVATLMDVPEVNGLRSLMMENGVASGSAGEDPEPGEPDEPDNPDQPDIPDEPDNPDEPDVPELPDIPEPPKPDLPGSMDEMAWQVLRLVNQHRMSIGREPLSVFESLQQVADVRAREIYKAYRPDHTRPDGKICWTAYQENGVLYHYSAENIASGQTTSASVMSSWLNSPGHRRNIESPKSVHIGVGHYYGTSPSAGRDNWTQDFAAAQDCRFSRLQLSASAIYARPGTPLETLLTDADVAVTANCYRHGACTLPLIADMCSGYRPGEGEDQTVTVTYRGQTAELTIAVRHSWDEGTVTTPASCTEAGVMTYACTDADCRKTLTAEIPAVGHSFAESGTRCSACGTMLNTALSETLSTNLAEGQEPVWTQEEAEAYAEALVQESLSALSAPQNGEIAVVDYLPPVNGTPDAPGGVYGYLDYTISFPETFQMERASGDASVLRLDIAPVSDDPADIHENAAIITFDPAGGTVNPASSTCEKDGTLSSLPTPSRRGYTFDGWFTAAGERVTTATVFHTDASVYARWSSVPDIPSSGSNSGSSSSGDSAPTYSVSCSSTTGGRVTVSPTSASAKRRVVVTPKANLGYELAQITVTGPGGKTLELVSRADGSYSFTMPEGAVAVEASFQAVQKPQQPWNNPFADVSGGAWYYDAVKFVHSSGLMNGASDNRFAPDEALSRAMLAQILYNKEGRPPMAAGNAFADVASNAWYANAVAWAAAKGVASGYGDGRFGPDDSITREQLAVMLWRYAGSPAAQNTALSFRDAGEISGYARQAVQWAAENGIVSGYGENTFAPAAQATRAQAAQMLKNFLNHN